MTQNEKNHCIGCNCIVHLEPLCAGLSNVAKIEIKELGLSCMLSRNNCVESKERHSMIQNWIIHKAHEQKEALKIEDKLDSLEVKLTFVVEKKVNEVLKLSCTETQNSY